MTDLRVGDRIIGIFPHYGTGEAVVISTEPDVQVKWIRNDWVPSIVGAVIDHGSLKWGPPWHRKPREYEVMNNILNVYED